VLIGEDVRNANAAEAFHGREISFRDDLGDSTAEATYYCVLFDRHDYRTLRGVLFDHAFIERLDRRAVQDARLHAFRGQWFGGVECGVQHHAAGDDHGVLAFAHREDLADFEGLVARNDRVTALAQANVDGAIVIDGVRHHALHLGRVGGREN